jgi:hypothetical protein
MDMKIFAQSLQQLVCNISNYKPTKYPLMSKCTHILKIAVVYPCNRKLLSKRKEQITDAQHLDQHRALYLQKTKSPNTHSICIYITFLKLEELHTNGKSVSHKSPRIKFRQWM